MGLKVEWLQPVSSAAAYRKLNRTVWSIEDTETLVVTLVVG